MSYFVAFANRQQHVTSSTSNCTVKFFSKEGAEREVHKRPSSACFVSSFAIRMAVLTATAVRCVSVKYPALDLEILFLAVLQNARLLFPSLFCLECFMFG
jgi:hypothetical protein